MKFICPICRCSFKRRGRKAVTCSDDCRHIWNLKIRPWRLAKVVQLGMSLRKMAQMFRSSIDGVRAAILREGLREDWRKARFRCRTLRSTG
jgi:hypothetical protein